MNLFDTTPKPSGLQRVTNARRTDPASSHDAARKHEASGRAGSHRRLVMQIIEAQPGRTSAEIARLTELDRHEVARRCSDLKNTGQARQGETRLCEDNNTKAPTWWPNQ